MNEHAHRVRATVGLAGLIAAWVAMWLALWAIAPAVFGWKPMVITSDSMRPAISAGDIVVARPHAGTELEPGTVVIFDLDDGRGLLTHRIVGITPAGAYLTKGDANSVRDSTPVLPDQIVGVGTLRVPLIGLPIVWYLSGAWGKLAALIATLGIALRLARRTSSQAHPVVDGAADDLQERADRLVSGITHAQDPDAVQPPAEPPRSPVAVGTMLGMLLVTLSVVAFSVTRAAFADSTTAADSQFNASWQLLYDVAVTDVRAPASAATGATVCVEVDVANLGSATTTFDVAVDDITRGKAVGTITVTDLASGGSTTLYFTWSPGGPPGTIEIQAEAILPGDEDPANNLDGTTMTLTTGGPPGGGGGC